MKILLLSGNHRRHYYLAHKLAETGFLTGIVIENREEFLPTCPPDLPKDTERLFIHHFAKRKDSENLFFGEYSSSPSDIDTLIIERQELNGPKVADFIDGIAPDILLSYGVHKLTEETLAHAQGERWNVHGGLSPWYRGVITNFWPSYFLEPQKTGMTVHDLTADIDGGDVVHQVAAPLVSGDGLHDIACRAVTALGEDLPKIIERLRAGKPIQKRKPRTTGRIWRSVDWRPAHLHLIYEVYGDRIVDRYLSGEFGGTEPKLHVLL